MHTLVFALILTAGEVRLSQHETPSLSDCHKRAQSAISTLRDGGFKGSEFSYFCISNIKRAILEVVK